MVWSVAVIGAGPRGMSVVERLLALGAQRETPLHIHVVDPGTPGVGVHRSQPDYLLLNTVAEELTGFADSAMLGLPVDSSGPNFYEWVIANGVACPGAKRTSYLPRRMLGEYLAYCFREHTSRAKPWVDVSVHTAVAKDIVSRGTSEAIMLDDGSHIVVDSVVLATGHGLPRKVHEDAGRHISIPYSLHESVQRIGSGSETVVGIRGMGLSAIDIVAALTHGRGGRFYQKNGLLRYRPSGNEPTMIWMSRTGMPFRARPDAAIGYKSTRPSCFTESAVLRQRGQTVRGQLDFEQDIVPLLIKEMAVILDDNDEAAALFHDQIPKSGFKSRQEYARWIERRIADDLVEAKKGVRGSAIKEALEIIWNCTDTIRLAVDQRGLTEGSKASFYSKTCAQFRRLVTGPHPDRAEEILALLRSGILRADLGPAPACGPRPDGAPGYRLRSTCFVDACEVDVDWIVEARSCDGLQENDLIDNLIAENRIRRCVVDGVELGLEVDENLRLLDVNGRASRSLFCYGPPIEGSTFYNHYVPAPSRPSRAVQEAHKIACAAIGDDREESDEMYEIPEQRYVYSAG